MCLGEGIACLLCIFMGTFSLQNHRSSYKSISLPHLALIVGLPGLQTCPNFPAALERPWTLSRATDTTCGIYSANLTSTQSLVSYGVKPPHGRASCSRNHAGDLRPSNGARTAEPVLVLRILLASDLWGLVCHKISTNEEPPLLPRPFSTGCQRSTQDLHLPLDVPR